MRTIGDEDLERAATCLVSNALRVVRGDRFVAVGDEESSPMLTALEKAGRAAGAETTCLRIDRLRSTSTNHTGERPHKVLPDGVRRAMLSAQASAFVASAPYGEASMRDQLLHVVGACRLRHAHMPNITPLAFAAGLATDYAELEAAGRELEHRLAIAREIAVTSDAGTELVVRTSRSTKWTARLGEIQPGVATSFPTGSIFAWPETVSGTFVATASLGEFFGAREGRLAHPVLFEIVDGYVKSVVCEARPDLVKDIETMLQVAPGSDRVGLAVIGVNAGIAEPTGEAVVDQHRPGLHLVIGDPVPKLTGATWTARTSFAACESASTVNVDGARVVDAGKLGGAPAGHSR